MNKKIKSCYFSCSTEETAACLGITIEVIIENITYQKTGRFLGVDAEQTWDNWSNLNEQDIINKVLSS